MLHFDPGGGPDDANYVEAVGLTREPVAGDPDLRGAAELTLLAPVDCLDRIPELEPRPRLHFHEDDRLPLLGHDIDVPMTVTVPPRPDPPTLAREPARGDALAQLS